MAINRLDWKPPYSTAGKPVPIDRLRGFWIRVKSCFCPDEDYAEWHRDYRSECGNRSSARGQPPYSTTGKPVTIDRLKGDWMGKV